MITKYSFVLFGIAYAIVTALVNVSFNQLIWWIGLIFGCLSYILGRLRDDY